MKNMKGSTTTELVVTLLAIIGSWGWVWNVVKIIDSDFANITGMLVMRVIGVFVAPLGAILGFF